MAQQLINHGTTEGDGTGESPFTGMSKVNDNFTELYTAKDAQAAALALKAPLNSPAFTGTPTGITKSHVGLGNVDNTPDNTKPVSTPQQAAIDAGDVQRVVAGDLYDDFVSSGLVTPTSANLTAVTTAGVAYVNGIRVVKAVSDTDLTFTYLATRDTYVDIDDNGVISRTAVVNGAAAPALASGSLRLEKVVTGASAVTSVTSFAPRVVKAPPVQIITTPSGGVSILGHDGNPLSLILSSYLYTVGPGGGYATIQDAVTAAGDPLTKRYGESANVTATAGSAVLVGTGTTWLAKDVNGASNIYFDDLWKPDLGSRYYRIKSVDSDTQITLYEPIDAGDAFSGTVNQSFYYLDRKTIFVLPGHHTADYVSLKPGIDFSAISPYSTYISESQGMNPYPFYLISDTRFHNLGVRANKRWGDMDSFGLCDTTIWAGAHCVIDSCLIDNRNVGNSHSGGSLTLPLLAGGLVEVINTEIRNSRSASIGSISTVGAAGTATPTLDNTRFRMQNCRIKIMGDFQTAAGAAINPAGLNIATLCAVGTFDIFDTTIWTPERNLNTSGANTVAGFKVVAASAANCVVNISNSRIDLTNTEPGGNATLGVSNVGATVNIELSTVKVAGSAPTAVNNGNASSITNIANSIVTGTTALNNPAGGTMVVNSRNNLITGTQTGTIT